MRYVWHNSFVLPRMKITSCLLDLEYADCIPCRRVPPHTHTPTHTCQGYPGYDSKLHLMVKFQSWKSRGD